MSRARNEGDDANVAVRLGTVEALLNEILCELRGRKRRAGKRVRSTAEQAYQAAVSDPNYKPTEMQIAAARRALAKVDARKRR